MMAAEPLPTLMEIAVSYAEDGWEIFPLKADKTPYTTHGMKDASSDAEMVRRWWRQWPDAIIGCRVPEDCLILDFDPRHNGDKTLAALEREFGPLPATRTHYSGRGDGGHHRWFRRPPGKLNIKGLNEWARERGVGQAIKHRWTAGVDLLHHNHRYTVLPPSPHPDTGKPYAWGNGAAAQTVELPAWFAEMLTVEPKPAPVAPPPMRTANGESIFVWFNSQTSWSEQLPGWSCVGGDGESNGSKWRHPQASNPWSATIREGRLYVYSGETEFEPTEEGDPNGHSKFDAWAMACHGGDIIAATRAAYEMRDGPRERHRDNLDDLITPPRPTGSGAEPEEPWPTPRPIGELDLPSWPIEMLPDWMAQHCVDVARRLQVPIDLNAQLALGVMAALCMGRVKVQVTRTWTEPTNLYLVTSMASGSGKSPASKVMTAPLRQLERELQEQTRTSILEAERRKKVATRRAKQLEEKAASGTIDVGEFLAAAAAADAIEVPERPRLIIDDATPEALVKQLSKHHRLAIVSTEAELFDIIQGVYAGKSGKVNVNVYLKAWSGDDLTVDRKGGGGTEETEYVIREPLLTTSVTVQPSVLAELIGSTGLADRGLPARFMPSQPRDLKGKRDHRLLMGDEPHGDTYDETVLAIGRRLVTWQSPAVLQYEPAAVERLIDWAQGIEARLDWLGDLADIAEWVSKIRGSVVRLSGILHMADGRPHAGKIDCATVERAIGVGHYWIAQVTGALVVGDPRTVLARRILRWAERRPDGEREPTIRDIYRMLGRAVESVEDVIDALELCRQNGWVRVIERATTSEKGGRPPSPMVTFNPYLWTSEGSDCCGGTSIRIGVQPSPPHIPPLDTYTHTNPLEASSQQSEPLAGRVEPSEPDDEPPAEEIESPF